MSLSSCLPFFSRDADREPLLPRHHDDTALQRQLRQKLHSYQMFRALGKGYMPSNEQTIANLRVLLAADVLNPSNPDLSDSGRLLVKYTRRWLTEFMELLQHKNGGDYVQDFIWFLTKSRVSLDVDHLAANASKAKSKADTAAAYKSLQTVGSLLLTNSDFRRFLSDIDVVARDVFKDTAFSLSNVARDVGKTLEPSEEEQQQLREPGAHGPAPTKQDLQHHVAHVSEAVGSGAADIAKDASHSLVEHLGREERDAMVHRLKQAVLKLRRRDDYSESVSTLSLLVKRYAMVYSRAAEQTLEAAQDGVHENAAMDRAAWDLWKLSSSFGDGKRWDELEQKFKRVMEHCHNDAEFESFLVDIGDALQKLLTDPDFLDHMEQRFQELRARARGVGTDSSLRKDVDELLAQAQSTLQAALHDDDIARLVSTTTEIVHVLSPKHHYANTHLLTDAINVFVPLLVQAIQHVPIPRLEVSTPDVDLLLENLIIEPGKTVNHSSFLPYRLRVETYNDLEIRKARFRTTSSVTSLVAVKLDGLTFRATEVGYWLRLHSHPWLRFTDSGIASFALDDRGIDVHLDVEVGRDHLEKVLSLRAVRVHVHKLSYSLTKSNVTFFSWLLQPIVRPILRKTLEAHLASTIADFLHTANRELLFARERLRATRIADPQDWRTFFQAVMARLKPREDPDLDVRVGVDAPGNGVFKGRYAPGSLVKLWHEEQAEWEDGWRNEVFDVHR